MALGCVRLGQTKRGGRILDQILLHSGAQIAVTSGLIMVTAFFGREMKSG